MIKEDVLNKVKTIIMADAEDRRMTAGMNGEHHDGGAKVLLKELDAFVSGFEERFPDSWKEYVEAAEKELEIEELAADKEYHTYLRLKKKFEHLD